jgi:ribonucleoside-triphosphate reductase
VFKQVRKRDGRIVPFDLAKIERAIGQALQATGTPQADIARSTAEIVVATLGARRGTDVVPHIEEIQDAVEEALVRRGLSRVAKAYILYRAAHERLRQEKQVFVDIQSLVGGYLDREDWRVSENSNAGYSFASLLSHISGSVVANYTLENVYPREIAASHRDGDLHIHDLSHGIVGYCSGWSLPQLLAEGFTGMAGRASGAPAKHLDTALGQIVNFMGTLQTEWAGAQAFSSFDTYLAPFVRYDGLGWREVKQAVQRFVFGLNIASRWGQTPFTNITLDWTVPEDLRDRPAVVGGKPVAERYGDFQAEMDLLNRAFLEIMLEGDRDGRIFTFPIPTYNLSRDFPWDAPNATLLFRLTGRYGTPYFQNFIRSHLRPGDVRAMCCRLQMDMKQLAKRTGGIFGNGESTGSVGVVTLNMPRLGYLCSGEKDFFGALAALMDRARDALEIKRKLVQRNIDGGLLPYTKHYLGHLNRHFSTIGLVGMNECCLNLLGVSIADPRGQEFAILTLNFLRDRTLKYQEETGHLYNLEATPAEGTSYRLARKDVAKFPQIVTAGEETPYYTNSTQLPVGFTDDVFVALRLQEDLQSLYSGGTVFHTYLGESIDDPEVTKSLVRRIACGFRIPYFSITPTFSVCPEHGYISGAHETCPCEVPDGEPSRVRERVSPRADASSLAMHSEAFMQSSGKGEKNEDMWQND